MARNVVDFMTAPSALQLVDANVDPIPYTGSARPDQRIVDAWTAAGHKPPSYIYESTSTWSQGGYDAGAGACPVHEQRAKEQGHRGSMMVVVSDGSAHDPNYGYEKIKECGRGWSDKATLVFYPYGNTFCCEAFLEGARLGAGAHLMLAGIGGGPDAMIPQTWGYGSIATQLVGPSPIPNTDLDIVHVDDLTGGSAPKPGAPSLFVMEVPRMTRSIIVGDPGVVDTFFVESDCLYWIHENPALPSPHKPVRLSGNADSRYPDIDILPTGYGPIITLRAKTLPKEDPACIRVKLVPFGTGAVYQAEYV